MQLLRFFLPAFTLFVFALPCQSAATEPSITIPKGASPPPLSGDPAGGAWERAAWVGNPVYLNAKEITSKFDWRAALLWDDTALYVGFKVKGFRKPVTITTTAGDDGLERDDAVEVCFKVPGFEDAKGQPVQFKLNCDGLRDDAIAHSDFKWNAEWEGKVHQDGRNWSATFKIPFANFGVTPKLGEQWEANLGVYLQGYDYRAFLWSPVAAGHHHSGDFGRFVFGDANTPASAIGPIKKQLSQVQVDGSLAAPGSVRLLLFSEGNATPVKETMLKNVIANFEDEETRRAARHSITPITKPGAWTATLDDVRPGDYQLKVVLQDSAGRPVNVDRKPISIRRSIETRILPYPVAGSASARIAVYDMGKPGFLPHALSVTVADAAGTHVRKIDVSPEAKLPVEQVVPLGKLENSVPYKVTAEATAADGTTRVEDTVEFTLTPRPAWADTDAGDSHGRVPKPWTPVRADGAALHCWGREYDFQGNLLPAAITSGSQAMLAGPMEVQIGTASGPVTLKDARRSVEFDLSAMGDRAEFSTETDSPVAEARISGYLEFDGFMAIDLTVRPKQPITSLALDLPLTSALARYIHPLPDASNRDESGTIPASGVRLAPQNTLWICNDSAGLYFACESTQQWNGGIEVLPQAGRTLLRFQFRKEGPPSTEERTYRFFLQTTPVRPFNPDWFENGSRVVNGLNFHTSEASLQKAKALGVKTLIFFEQWASAQNGGWSKREPELKKIVADCHRLGLKVIFYFGFEMADVPEHKDMLEECKALINRSANYYAPARQHTYWVSYGGPYQEYLLHHMRRLKEEVGIDGVYLDGSLNLSASDNPAFGCGYVNEKGERVPTVPVERIRSFARRINELFVQDGGTVFAHLSVTPPTMGFVSNCYLGEHVGFLSTDWQSVTDRIPNDVARAQYNANNTGVPMVLCIQNMWPHLRGVKPFWFPRALAWANLYRVRINVLIEDPMAAEGVAVLDQNRALAEFGADQAEWIPYWQSDSPVRCEPSDLKASVYRRKDGAMVCAVANLSAQAVKGRLIVPAGMKCTELVGGKATPMEDGKAILDIAAYEGQMLKIESGKTE